jgi:flagellin
MAQVINTNVQSLFAQRQLNRTSNQLQTSLERLSSGLRINSAKDDAAGLAIASRFSAQIRGLDQAARNANDGISLAQTAESALDQMTNNLQRLRELSVQAANGSLSSSDRASLNEEAQQLVAEIDRVSESTQFNGVSLLDGSAQNLSLQIGSNAFQTVEFSIDSARTDRLGVMQTTSLSAMFENGDATATAAMQQGDLVLNGVVVGASLASYDSSSSVDQDQSAIAKAGAINAVSDQTGVSAQVNTNLLEGSSMTTSSTTSGNISLNGVTIALSTLSGDEAATRAVTVQAINNVSGQTGVTAVDSGSDTTGVQLVAEDGRNISLSFGAGVNAAQTGLTSAVAYGTFTLVSDDTITVQEGLGGALERTGLAAGSYEKGLATFSVTNNNGASIVAGDFRINGALIGASLAISDPASTADASASAIAKVAAINEVSDESGVTARVNDNVADGTTMVGADADGTVTINGVDTENFATDATDLAATRQNVVNAVNAISGQTGVVAVDTGDDSTGVQLVAEDGRNITVAFDGTHTGASTGLAGTATYHGTYTLESSTGIVIEAGTTGDEENGGLSLGTFGIGESGTAIQDLDLGSVEGANAAIAAVDNALDSINSNRSNLGAIQNRLSSTIDQLQSASENFSAARSRIQDTDFAAETAALTRAQILQQAGVAMLAQANSAPQLVLSLLQ